MQKKKKCEDFKQSKEKGTFILKSAFIRIKTGHGAIFCVLHT